MHVSPTAVEEDCSHEQEELGPTEPALIDGVGEEDDHEDEDGEVVGEPGQEEASPPCLDSVTGQTVYQGRC